MLRGAKSVWRSFHPECSISGGRITSKGLSFMATRKLGAGVKVKWFVDVWKVDDESCFLEISMGLYDERVNALRSIAHGSDASTNFLSFDVLAASSVMHGQKMPDYPAFRSRASVEEFARAVGDYSRRIDRLWNSVGGVGIPGFERLAIWALRNPDAGTSCHSLYGGPCAAFTYGERELAHHLIAELRSQWEEQIRLEPSDLAFKIYNQVHRDLERLQAAVEQGSGLT
jgi:hypothetical protein